MRVQVITLGESNFRRLDNLLTGSTVGEKVINWNDSSDRKWLVNHQHWAMHHNMAVLVRPVDEAGSLDHNESN